MDFNNKRLEELKVDVERKLSKIENFCSKNFYSPSSEKMIKLIKNRFGVNVCEEEVSPAHASRELLITIIALRLMKRDPCPTCHGFGKKDNKDS